MRRYLFIGWLGLLWAGSAWPAEDFCAAHGRMAGKLAAARVAGLPEAQARAAVVRPDLPPHIRDLVASTVDLAYADQQSPDAITTIAEALCRQNGL